MSNDFYVVVGFLLTFELHFFQLIIKKMLPMVVSYLRFRPVKWVEIEQLVTHLCLWCLFVVCVGIAKVP